LVCVEVRNVMKMATVLAVPSLQRTLLVISDTRCPLNLNVFVMNV